MAVRKSIPRADNICKIRDITCICEGENANTTKHIFKLLEVNEIGPPKELRWSLSNLREHLSALFFLKLAIRTRRAFYLLENGKKLKKIAAFKAERLSEDEKHFFTKILFENERFVGFLGLFSNGLPVFDVEDFVKCGKEISLREEDIKSKAIELFGYYDKREFSERGVFRNWAMSIEIIEKDLEEGTYFPTVSREIEKSLFSRVLFKEYVDTRDKKTLRAAIFKVRSRVCKSLKIPSSLFDKYIKQLNSQIPHIVSLERAPLASFRSPEYGLIRDKGGIVYYLRIRRSLVEPSAPFEGTTF